MNAEDVDRMVRQFVEKAEHDLGAARILANEAGLADYGVAPRYPGWEPEAGPADPDEALAAARLGAELIRPLTNPQGVERRPDPHIPLPAECRG